jgi:hypothetical protein
MQRPVLMQRPALVLRPALVHQRVLTQPPMPASQLLVPERPRLAVSLP